MEFDDNYQPAEEQGYDVEIYSRTAIFWFTILFTPLFGGTLMIINLRSAGYKTAAWVVGAFALIYYIIENYTANYLTGLYIGKMTRENLILILGGIALVLNIIAAMVLLFGFYRRYFPEKDYYPKSVMPPLMVAVVLFILYTLIAPYIIPGK